jgi:hypothetical protein
MEHRWGARHAADHAVQLRTRDGVASQGRVVDVSISGALIATLMPAPTLSYIRVFLASDQPDRRARTMIEGQVVRHTAEGFALEWCEFAPDAVRALSTVTLTVDPRLVRGFGDAQAPGR